MPNHLPHRDHQAAERAAARAALTAAEHHIHVSVTGWVGTPTGHAAITLADGSRLLHNPANPHPQAFDHVIECRGGITHRQPVNGPHDIDQHRAHTAACPDHQPPAKPYVAVFRKIAAIAGRRLAAHTLTWATSTQDTR